MNGGVAGLVVLAILLAVLGVLALAMKIRREERRRREEENLRRILKCRYGGEETGDGK
jgi:Flp pilus assembly protein TadB